MKSFLDFEEKNVEKAIQKACTDLNVAREKLKYDIISHGSSGIFGLVGAKKALIRVFVPGTQKTKLSDHGMAAGAQPDDKSTEYSVNALVDEAFGEVTPPAETRPKPTPRKKPSAAKQAPKNQQQKKNQPAGQPQQPEKEKSQKPREDKQKAEPEKDKAETEKSTEAQPITQSTVDDNLPPDLRQSDPEATSETDADMGTHAAMSVARDLAHEIFKTMGVEAELSEKTVSNQSWINVKVAEPGILIGKRGQTLEAIQYLADKVVSKQCGKGNRVIFDVEGYVESRKTELKDLAARLASKALKTGKPSTMTRMNAHDRRVVHMSLKKNRAVRTQSVGDGYYRKLIIFPKKKSTRKTEKAGPAE